MVAEVTARRGRVLGVGGVGCGLWVVSSGDVEGVGWDGMGVDCGDWDVASGEVMGWKGMEIFFWKRFGRGIANGRGDNFVLDEISAARIDIADCQSVGASVGNGWRMGWTVCLYGLRW